ncbi:MAG: hypothetical protein IKA16_01925 [Oscillospiraceae bacterium]|nr:hypothetical protein [Oscillospiraceae bacterium]
MVKYWYFLLPAILMALIPGETINTVTKKWIPDEKKRAKFFMGILTGCMTLTTVLLFLVSENIPWHVRLPLCLFPLVSVGLGFLLGKFFSRKK